MLGILVRAATSSSPNNGNTPAWSIPLGLLIIVAWYFLPCYFIYKTAKKLDTPNRWTAWVPFFGQIYLMWKMVEGERRELVVLYISFLLSWTFIFLIFFFIFLILMWIEIAKRMGRPAAIGVFAPFCYFLIGIPFLGVIAFGTPDQAWIQSSRAARARANKATRKHVKQGYPPPPPQGYAPPQPPQQGYAPPQQGYGTRDKIESLVKTGVPDGPEIKARNAVAVRETSGGQVDGSKDMAQDCDYLKKCLEQACIEEKEERAFNSDPSFNKVRGPLNQREYSKACIEAEKLVKQFQDFDLIYYWWAGSLLYQGLLEPARKVALQGLGNAKRKYMLCARLGVIQTEIGNIEDAVYWFAQAIHCQESLGSENSEEGPYLYLSSIADGIGLHDCSKAFLEKVDRIRPGQVRLDSETANRIRVQASSATNEDIEQVIKALANKYTTYTAPSETKNTQIKDEAAQAKKPPVFCTYCGSKLEYKGAKFCASCGKEQGTESLGEIEAEKGATEAIPDDPEIKARHAVAVKDWDAAVSFGEHAVQPLIEALVDTSGDVRKAAAEALGKLGDARSMPSLIKGLLDSDNQVRQAAAGALGGVTDDQVVLALCADTLAHWDKPSSLWQDALIKEYIQPLLDNEDKDSKKASLSEPKPFICSKCNKKLQTVNMSRPAITFGGSMPTLRNGVVCNNCHRYECTDCKGAPADAPCSWCGGSVSPAYE